MTNPKLTPWFTKGEKPVHIGVYNVSCRKYDQTGNWYSYWDGNHFKSFGTSVAQAYYYSENGNYYSNEKGSWRGHTSNPELTKGI